MKKFRIFTSPSYTFGVTFTDIENASNHLSKLKEGATWENCRSRAGFCLKTNKGPSWSDYSSVSIYFYEYDES